MEKKAPFAHLLSKFRERKGYNRSNLAKALGVSLPGVSRWEDLRVESTPSAKNLARICQVLNLSEEERNSLFEAAFLKEDDVEQVNMILKSMLKPMFNDEVVEILTDKEFLKIVQTLVEMSIEERKEAIKMMQVLMKGFS
jgi:transcriptional regulator with XRE-family HTH domain